MITAVHHIGIAVADLSKAMAFYHEKFGVEAETVEPPAGITLSFAIVRLAGCEIELLAPNADTTPITRFLNDRGPGVHHIAFQVDDIREAMSALDDRAIPALTEDPQPGVEDTLTCFFHPKKTMGVLYEFVETRSSPGGNKVID